jgi:hypothetical protein
MCIRCTVLAPGQIPNVCFWPRLAGGRRQLNDRNRCIAFIRRRWLKDSNGSIVLKNSLDGASVEGCSDFDGSVGTRSNRQ